MRGLSNLAKGDLGLDARPLKRARLFEAGADVAGEQVIPRITRRAGGRARRREVGQSV